VVLAVVPYIIGFGGITYAVAAVASGAFFLYLAWRVRTITEGREGDKAARHLFGFSILYLFLLFTVLLVEHAVWRLA
jgi:protoheme IX farnesyltransferase